MSKTGKKKYDERLQEVRNPRQDKVQYRKRKQQDEDAEKQLKEYERRSSMGSRTD